MVVTVWQNPGPLRMWDISPDGTRFIVVKTVDASGSRRESEVYVVTNWFEELKARMGGRQRRSWRRRRVVA
jgi:hypothetical protein